MNTNGRVCGCQGCAKNLAVLGLDTNVTAASINEAYRDLVKIWHPDRFESDQRVRKRAEEQFKSIQVAFRELQEHLTPSVSSSSNSSAAAPDTSDVRERRGWNSANQNQPDSTASLLFRQLLDGRRFFMSPQLPTHAIEAVRRHDPEAAASLRAFCDMSLTMSGRSFVAFSSSCLVIREFFMTTRVSYADLRQWKVTFARPDNASLLDQIADDMAKKIFGDRLVEFRDQLGNLETTAAFRSAAIARAMLAIFREVQRYGRF